jgi:hypothetical protein
MMGRSLTFTCALAGSLVCCPAFAQDSAVAKPDLLLRGIVSGMPKGDKQEVRVFSATLNPGDRTPRFP